MEKRLLVRVRMKGQYPNHVLGTLRSSEDDAAPLNYQRVRLSFRCSPLAA